MKRTVEIRPEQARELIALNAAADEARRVFGAALKVALAGLADGKARVDTIDDDGTVTLTVPDEGEQ